MQFLPVWSICWLLHHPLLRRLQSADNPGFAGRLISLLLKHITAMPLAVNFQTTRYIIQIFTRRSDFHLGLQRADNPGFARRLISLLLKNTTALISIAVNFQATRYIIRIFTHKYNFHFDLLKL